MTDQVSGSEPPFDAELGDDYDPDVFPMSKLSRAQIADLQRATRARQLGAAIASAEGPRRA